jgi:hypothetical protein
MKKQTGLYGTFLRGFIAVVFVTALMGVGSANAATVYDLAGDLHPSPAYDPNDQPNPNGTWSYGTYNNGLNPNSLNLFTAPIYFGLGSLFGWFTIPDYDTTIAKSYEGYDVDENGRLRHANQVSFTPELWPTVARWTAPSDGTFRVDAVFATVEPDITVFAPNAYVYDGVSLVDLGVVPEYGSDTVEYHETLAVGAGQVIDFVVWGGDVHHKTTEVSATITAMTTPSDMIEELINSVIDLNLQQGMSNSLDAKLTSVLSALDDLNENNDVAAINTLYAFIQAVEAQSEKITEEDANSLINEAQLIIDAIESQ